MRISTASDGMTSSPRESVKKWRHQDCHGRIPLLIRSGNIKQKFKGFVLSWTDFCCLKCVVHDPCCPKILETCNLCLEMPPGFVFIQILIQSGPTSVFALHWIWNVLFTWGQRTPCLLFYNPKRGLNLSNIWAFHFSSNFNRLKFTLDSNTRPPPFVMIHPPRTCLLRLFNFASCDLSTNDQGQNETVGRMKKACGSSWIEIQIFVPLTADSAKTGSAQAVRSLQNGITRK